ncbi:hypothetical protein PAMP_008800 [Pampus punctatissimus]
MRAGRAVTWLRARDCASYCYNAPPVTFSASVSPGTGEENTHRGTGADCSQAEDEIKTHPDAGIDGLTAEHSLSAFKRRKYKGKISKDAIQTTRPMSFTMTLTWTLSVRRLQSVQVYWFCEAEQMGGS